jgi:tRNA-guanine family transglycosylase
MKDDLVSDVPAQSLLVNVFDVAKNGVAFRRLMNRAGRVPLVLDSGGYQLYLAEGKDGFNPIFNPQLPLSKSARNFNLMPEHVVDVTAQVNPDIVMAQDFPIRKIQGALEQQREFYRKFPFNRDWALRTSQLMIQRGLDTNRLFIPIQCYTIEQFKIFYRCIRNCAFGGLSMPVRNLRLERILDFLLEMHDFGVRCVHVLGTSAAKTITLSAFMARHFFRWVSLDSTTWLMMADSGKYLDCNDLREIKVGQKDPISRTTALDCECTWCRRYIDFGNIIDMEPGFKTGFLYRHNFTVTEYFARNAYANAISAAMLEQFVQRNFSNIAIRNETISAIRKAERAIIDRRQGQQTATQLQVA